MEKPELSAKQVEARKRLHEQTAKLISDARANAGEEGLKWDPTEPDPEGPPWNYEPTPEEREAKQQKKAQRAAKRQQVKTSALEKTPTSLKNPSSLQVRFRTGLVYTLLTLACVMLGDIPFLIYLMIVAGICAGEFYFILRKDAKLPNEVLGIVGAVMYIPATYFGGLAGAMLVSLALLLALLVWYVFWLRSRIPDVAVSFLGAAYTGLLLCGLVVIRQSVEGIWGSLLLLCLFLSVWANDAFAYLVGSKFGNHQLAPRTSPKKSWEGFFGGLVGSVVFWVVIMFIPGVNMPIYMAVLFGIICGLCEVLGDLVESRIKRNSGVKDSGSIMPGHGGLLDRCDSLFLASIVSAILLIGAGCIPYPF